MGQTKQIISRINQLFSMDCKMELYKLSESMYGDSNKRTEVCFDILRKYNIEFTNLGTGTNRVGIKIGEYCYKIALDPDGRIDNKREFKYAPSLYPYVIKCYEMIPNGLIMVCEYVDSLGPAEYVTDATRSYMRKILAEISRMYLIGDVGLTNKNRANWGRRSDGELVVLDFAYAYLIDYKAFVCSCDKKSILQYDDDFVLLVCPKCGKKYTFSDIRKTITRKSQDEEIGDISKEGYILHDAVERQEVNPKFIIFRDDDKDPEEREEIERKKWINKSIKEYYKKQKEKEEESDI